MKPYAKGILIATCGVLAATPDGVLIRWATKLGAPATQVIFWKVLFNGLWGLAMVCFLEKWKGGALLELARGASRGWRFMAPATVLQASIVILFPTAFLLTFAANVLLCVSLSPLFAAILGAAVLSEVLPTRTIRAISAALVAVVIIFLPKLLGSAPPSSGEVDNASGDVAALVVSLITACYLVLARAAGLAEDEVPVEAASAVGALCAAVVVAAYVVALGGSVFDGTSPLFFLAMWLNGLGLASIYLSFSIAPRYISGAQVGLISLLETVIGPLWCFVIYGETPPPATLVGGALLVLAVAVHEIVAMYADDQDDDASAKSSERADLRVAASDKTYTPLEVQTTP
mmetsp:Transcript_3248/g.10077  ORF Transcript_3248/g.10077 Transcript_3248/m.10077 type:complete len:345 (-) Transcript_3248:257-1291(-)